MDPNPPTSVTTKRKSNTCATCRARKVRCDGQRSICNNCHRLGFSCSYDNKPSAGVGAGRGLDTAGNAWFPPPVPFTPPRRRVRQACLSCHSRKARCSGTTPKCERCQAQGLECVYRPGRRSRLSGGPLILSPHEDTSPREDHLSDHSRSISADRIDLSSATPSTFGHDMPCMADDRLETVALQTFDNFFRHVHHIPVFTFLHRASLMQRYHAGLLDRPLLLALVGITSLLTDLGQGMKEYGDACIDEAEELVLADVDRPSTLRLQAMVLVMKHRIYSRRFSRAFMLFSMASRFASALRLNHENPKLCFLAQESRRRLMWALYIMDTTIAGGNKDFSLWAHRPEALRIQLPCNERNFEYDLPEETEPLIPVPDPDGQLPPLPDDIGFLALHIRMHLLRNRVQQYTRAVQEALASSSDTNTEAFAVFPARCAELAAELEGFANRLPASFRWSESNVCLRTYSPRLCVFLMTHVWWEQCHIDLYRVALYDAYEGPPRTVLDRLARAQPAWVQHCAAQAWQHARAMADMFGMMLTLDNGIPVMDLDLAVCLYHCARTLLYALETTPEFELGVSREGVTELAGVCLRVLRLCISTPATAGIRIDLERLIAAKSRAAGVANGPEIPSELAQRPGEGPPSSLPCISGHSLVEAAVHAADDDTTAMVSTTPVGGLSPSYVNANSNANGTRALIYAPLQPTMPMDTDADGTREDAAHTLAVMSNGTSVGCQSNAFEGALDGLDFGGMQSLGGDGVGWFSGDWMAGLPQGEFPSLGETLSGV